MSLINQMLQDIERRESGRQLRAMSSEAPGPQRHRPGNAPASHTAHWVWVGLLALTLAALAGAAAAWWLAGKAAVPARAAAGAALVPMVQTKPEPAAVVQAIPEPVTTAVPQVTAAAPPPLPPVPAASPALAKPVAAPPALALAATTPAAPQARAPLASAPTAPTANQASAVPRVERPVSPQPGQSAPTAAARTAAPAPIAVSPPSAAPARAEQLYQQALAASQQSQPELALQSLREALESQSSHVPARLALARLLVEKKQANAAADLLADGLMLLPQQASFALALAPLWLQSGRQDEAMGLLAQSARSAGNSPDYHGYYAAQLLQLKRHADAAKHYSIALGSNPVMVDWLIGLGLSLQGTRNDKEALEAFKRAYDTGSLTGQKRELVEQMIAGLKARLGP